MPRFILSLRYLKMKKPSQVKNYVRYVATRPNAEKFEVNQSQREATEHQKRWIEKELKAHKELRESCEQEYECFILGKHTARNGVAGISPPRREFQKC